MLITLEQLQQSLIAVLNRITHIENNTKNTAMLFNLNELVEDKEWGTVTNAWAVAIPAFKQYLDNNNIQMKNGMSILFKTSDELDYGEYFNDHSKIWQEWLLVDATNYQLQQSWRPMIHHMLDGTGALLQEGLISKLEQQRIKTIPNVTSTSDFDKAMTEVLNTI